MKAGEVQNAVKLILADAVMQRTLQLEVEAKKVNIYIVILEVLKMI